MSQAADFRDTLKAIHDMMPLTDRETALANMVIGGYCSECGTDDLRDDRKWYGEKAIKAFEAVTGEKL